MIVYDPFWKTLESKELNGYKLTEHYDISSSTLDRLRNNKPITTTTLNDFCNLLQCRVEDILLFVPDGQDPPPAGGDTNE